VGKVLFKTPADTYRAYERFLKKHNFRKAYKCLKVCSISFPAMKPSSWIREPGLFQLWNYEMARPWLLQLTEERSLARLCPLSRARPRLEMYNRPGYLANRRNYLRKGLLSDKRRQGNFSEIEDLIKYHEEVPFKT
jgi:hypothetical protein